MSAPQNIHASCVALGARGVLLMGASGQGKSDLALRLIDGGASLVADDRCLLSVRRGRLYVQPPAALAGLIELRGVGIVRLPWRKGVAVALAVSLEEGPRLPEPAFYVPLAEAAAVPLIRLNARAPGAAALVRMVLKAHGLAAVPPLPRQPGQAQD